jgi:hypothetical protein
MLVRACARGYALVDGSRDELLDYLRTTEAALDIARALASPG